MKQSILVFLFLVFVLSNFLAIPLKRIDSYASTINNKNLLATPNAWINELHYENTGADVGEFIEVVVQNPGDYTLSDLLITLYNGATGASYGTHNLGTFSAGSTDPTDASFTYYYKNIASIQNGDPDGISLSYLGTVIMFLSYEGTFTASDGVANGMTSIDIGVSESDPGTATGASLGLTGTGTSYGSFTWSVLSDDTPGNPNTGQTLPVELSSFAATTQSNAVNLKWITQTETNNYGFEVERVISSTEPIEGWQKIGFVAGAGNSNSPKIYSFSDNKISGFENLFYRLKQIDTDGKYEYSDVVEVKLKSLSNYVLNQNYPNPFNPSTVISYFIPKAAHVKLSIYNILGCKITDLVNDYQEAGYYSKEFSIDRDVTFMSNGVYFYKLEAGNFTDTKKFILMK